MNAVTQTPPAPGSFGEVMVSAGFIDSDELSSALREQAREAKRGHWVLLGQVLLGWELITPQQLETSVLTQALYQQHSHFKGATHPSVNDPLKRLVDIVGALVGLGLTASVMPLIAGAIELEDGGPLFFRQTRVGLQGRQFGIMKFRTMVPDADRRKLSVASQSETFFAPGADHRITRVGCLLRKTLLDELPQFWNVLVGEMSLVGTRPPTLDEVWHYEERHWGRLAVRGGMTGLWQATADRHGKSFEEVVKLDCEYAHQWSLRLDALIIVKTVLAAFENLRRA